MRKSVYVSSTYLDLELLFEAEGYRFLGICTPAQARRVLARQFPAVENASSTPSWTESLWQHA